MGFLDWIPIVQDVKRGLDHEKHQLLYHPEHERKSGFNLSNLSSIGQGFSSFADGFTGGSEMGAQDRVDAAYQDDNKKTRGYQRKPGESAYHYVTQ